MTRIIFITLLIFIASCSLKTKEQGVNYGTQLEKDMYGNSHIQTCFSEESFNNKKALNAYNKAIDKSEKGDLSSAIRHMKEALLNDRNNKMILNDLGALFNRNNMLDSAKHYTKKSLEVDSTNICALNNYGLYLYSENNDLQAIEFFNIALIYDSMNSAVYVNKALAYQQLGELDSCCIYLEKAKECNSYDMANYIVELMEQFCNNRNIESEKVIKQMLENINN